MDSNGVGPQASRSGATTPDDSLDIILDFAWRNYERQFRSLDSYRARAGSLLAFAAVLVTLSASPTSSADRNLTQAGGTLLVVVAAVLFLAASVSGSLQVTPPPRTLRRLGPTSPQYVTKQQILRGTLEALAANQRALVRVRSTLSIGLVCLLVGTVIIGLRVAVLLP